MDPRHVNKFDVSNLIDYNEKVQVDPAYRVHLINPLINTPGCLVVTDEHVYFQPAKVSLKNFLHKFKCDSVREPIILTFPAGKQYSKKECY